PLETPSLEYQEILTGKYGEEIDKQLYLFKDNGDRDIGLIFDLTVPLCRVVAMYPDLPKPFKRYQIQRVWRAEKPQSGRFREFYQCDVDIVGSAEALADTEIILIAIETLQALGVKDFTIKINNRKILNEFLTGLGIKEKDFGNILRAIDKRDKIGEKEMREQLDIDKNLIDRIIEFINIKGSNEEILKKIKKIIGGTKGFEELEEVVNNLSAGGVEEKYFQVDLAMVRGADYYTGMIFETILNSLPKFGSVMSGGRYDKLISLFLGKEIPAVGISLGIDRLLAGLTELGLVKEKKSLAEVLVTIFDQKNIKEYLKIAGELRKEGIKTELYSQVDDLRKQIKYADKQGIPWVVIAGEDELGRGEVSIKNMRTGQQQSVKIKQIKNFLK
ncbi:MAG: histidine--tRNA ligase, partial [bacterium]